MTREVGGQSKESEKGDKVRGREGGVSGAGSVSEEECV